MTTKQAHHEVADARARERKAFTDGYKEGVRTYAIWTDGVQLVGAMQRPLKEVIDGIDYGRDRYFDAVLATWESRRKDGRGIEPGRGGS